VTRAAVLPVYQQPLDKRPKMFAFPMVPDLSFLHGEFLFHHGDLCMFHQMYYATFDEHQRQLDERDADLQAKVLTHHPVDEGDEYVVARIREGIYADGLAFSQTAAFADELLVVGLWATVVQFASRALTAIEAVHSAKPHRPNANWGQIQTEFESFNVRISNLTRCDDIDELRLINNAVKHSGAVTPRLAKLPRFADSKGERFLLVEYPLQRYADAVWELLGHLLRAADDACVAYDPDSFGALIGLMPALALGNERPSAAEGD
jgi:hypothetical protein